MFKETGFFFGREFRRRGKTLLQDLKEIGQGYGAGYRTGSLDVPHMGAGDVDMLFDVQRKAAVEFGTIFHQTDALHGDDGTDRFRGLGLRLVREGKIVKLNIRGQLEKPEVPVKILKGSGTGFGKGLYRDLGRKRGFPKGFVEFEQNAPSKANIFRDVHRPNDSTEGEARQ